MSNSKKDRPLSPQEILRRKEAAQKQALLVNAPAKSYANLAGKAGKFAPKKSANFRHQGR
jgi:hypothetical protein